MLETQNLTKIYKPKKGVPVRALDGVNIRFPDKGMVFLLGKSGSGKSTLLNVLGGLDRYDAGEITIKGVSSAAFKQRDFDSYRNTLVGFIFQEYNILDEFTVGANIALALELQGKKASDEELNRILAQVDLAGYGARKPNELSGGQKQRVAIARALVKNPEIIMADEPTGALDSVTGRQVLDTLKRLSADKLVIVVSHDREFAEQYADRIIELSDGKVISDMEYDGESAAGSDIAFSGSTVTLRAGYHLTEADRAQINEYIDALSRGEVKLELAGQAGRAGRPTDQTKIPVRTGRALQFIRSKLPLKNAFRIGAGGLKYKKFRLAVTIFLSCVAFGLFGLADTFGAYNHVETCTRSILDTGVNYASVGKSIKRGDWYESGFGLDAQDIATLEAETGIPLNGVYSPRGGLVFDGQYNTEAEFTKSDFHIYAYGFNGFMELTRDQLSESNYTILAGRLPDGDKNEIAISEYVCHTFMIGGYRANSADDTFEKIEKPADMVGKTLWLDNKTYTITGIIDTNFDIARYVSLTEEKEHRSNAEQLLDYALYAELSSARDYSLAEAAMVGAGHVDRFAESHIKTYETRNGHLTLIVGGWDTCTTSAYAQYMVDPAALPEDAVIWKDDKARTLGMKDVILAPQEARDLAIDAGADGAEGLLASDATMLASVGVYNGADDSWDDYEEDGYRLVGLFNTEKYPELQYTFATGDPVWKRLVDTRDGIYDYVVGVMPTEKEDVRRLVSFCNQKDAEVRYELYNAVTFELDTVNEALEVCSRVFLYIGLFFALFAALMLANFIGTSISYKKQEIGILRAIGSRSGDVFRIFFSESFIIAMINFVLSAAGVCVFTILINLFIRYQLNVLITVLHFGLRQIILLFGVSVAIAFLASFLPVRAIAAKRPIDAIRSR